MTRPLALIQPASSIRALASTRSRAFLAVLALGLASAAPIRAQTHTGPRPKLGDTISTPSGLKYFFTKEGNGPWPDSGDVMVIHGIGKFLDGKEFWNTRTDGAPYEFTPGVDHVIKGFEEGMHFVREGDRIVIVMTPDLAYGARARPDIPANSTLVFDYEILSVKHLSIARLFRDGMATQPTDSVIAHAKALPNLRDYYVTPAAIQSAANTANRKHAGDGEHVLAFGLTLLPDAYQLHRALGRSERQRADTAAAIKSYEQALRLNKQSTPTEKTDYEADTKALAELKKG